MISVVLYGRNDSYGYNLHKRAALSLNCIAELLTHETDEILFVDYNTPDDYPTFPEAIQDTLTPRGRRLLRILRVRPKHHQRFKNRTHLVALEPVARNVAVRRSNPANRWILSTNTDMIFVPRDERSLSQIVAAPPDGLYHLPRFEIPESLWETLDRSDPANTISQVERWGRKFHLNEIVHARDPWVRFDAPGDFQLMPRSDLFRISGFHEEMLLGWHVDSNLARRLYFLYSKTSDLLPELYGYHCDHTRQVTPMHRSGSVQNDLVKYNDNVTVSDLPEQADSWGLAGETIEELTVERTSTLYVRGLAEAIKEEMPEPTHLHYAPDTYGKVDYSVAHVLPFLVDVLASYSRDTRIGWFGSRIDLLEAFANALRQMAFTRPLLVARGAAWLGETLPPTCSLNDPEALCREADVLIFDWGLLTGDLATVPDPQRLASIFVARWLRHAARDEEKRLRETSSLPRRFIAVNAIHNRMESLVASRIGAAHSPMASRIRQGFVEPSREEKRTTDLIGLFVIGDAGMRENGRIITRPGKTGHVVYGPYLTLDPGKYRLDLALEPTSAAGSTTSGLIALDVFADPYVLAVRTVTSKELGQRFLSVNFEITEELIDLVPWSCIEFRLRSDGKLPFALVEARLEKIETETAFNSGYDMFPLLIVGGGAAAAPSRRLGRVTALIFRREGNGLQPSDGIRSQIGKSGHVVCGPYITLPPGRYEAKFGLRVFAPRKARKHGRGAGILLDVVADTARVELACSAITSVTNEISSHVLYFDTGADTRDVEFRVWSDGNLSFAVEAVRVRPVPGTGDSAPVMRTLAAG